MSVTADEKLAGLFLKKESCSMTFTSEMATKSVRHVNVFGQRQYISPKQHLQGKVREKVRHFDFEDFWFLLKRAFLFH